MEMGDARENVQSTKSYECGGELKTLRKCAKIILVANPNCDMSHAVVISIRYILIKIIAQPTASGTSLAGVEVSSSESGDSTIQGRMIEPAREINEKKNECQGAFSSDVADYICGVLELFLSGGGLSVVGFACPGCSVDLVEMLVCTKVMGEDLVYRKTVTSLFEWC